MAKRGILRPLEVLRESGLRVPIACQERSNGSGETKGHVAHPSRGLQPYWSGLKEILDEGNLFSISYDFGGTVFVTG